MNGNARNSSGKTSSGNVKTNESLLEPIADRCTPDALAVLHKMQDKDILALVIDALKVTDGAISDGTIMVILLQIKDELRKQARR